MADPLAAPNAHEAAHGEAPPTVLVRRAGRSTRITLNRPRAINALNREMVGLLVDAIVRAQGDGSRAIVLDGEGERGFCGGGDVKALASGTLEQNLDFLRTEYLVDSLIARSPVPVVALMHGVCMGGGIGLGGHAAVRVVTETSRLAMPEVRIGILPDVGGHHLLAAAPGRLGELLAITSGGMGAGDAVALGFADWFVPGERLPALREWIAAGVPAADAVARVAESAPESPLLAAREWFDPIADAALGGAAGRDSGGGDEAFADPAAAAQRLIAGLEASAHPEALSVAETVRGMCPTSVAATLAQIARTRGERLSLAEVLADDVRLMGRMVVRPDFAEGVRAQLIDRDGAPAWSPARIEQLDRAELRALLDPAHAEGERPLDLGR